MAETPQKAPGNQELRYALIALPVALVLFLIGNSGSDEGGDLNVFQLLALLLAVTGVIWVLLGLWKKLS